MAILSSEGRRPLSLTARLALGAVLWCALALTVAGLALVGLFRAQVEREADRTLNDRLVQLVALSEVSPRGGVRLVGPMTGDRFERPFSGWAWQVREGETVVLQSASLGPVTPGGVPVLAAPVGGVGQFDGPLGQRLRGVARRVAPRLAPPLTFAVARPEAEIEADLAAFRRAVLLTLGTLGAGLVASVLGLMRLGLRPLAELRAKVAAIRGAAPQPGRAWPRELAPVAEELDSLGAHVGRLVTRARGQAADLAHALKTPLAVVRQIAERAPGEGPAIIAQLDRIALTLDRHLGRSRAAGTALARVDIARCLDDLEPVVTAAPGRAVRVARAVPDGAVFIGDEADLFEVLGTLLDNAAKFARSEVRVTVAPASAPAPTPTPAPRPVTSTGARPSLAITVEDDGPGIAPGHRRAILERGSRLDSATPGQGLGLAIAGDIVALYAGSLALEDAALGGLAVRVTLPGEIAATA